MPERRTPTARERALLAVLRECETALTDWLRTYADTEVSDESLRESVSRIQDSGGTLAYIGKLLDKIRAHTGRKRGTKA